MACEVLQKLISPKFTKDRVLDIVAKQTAGGLKEVSITELKFEEDPSKKGDAYLSQTFRFIIAATGINKIGQTETVNIPVFAKNLPLNIVRRKTFRAAEFFENESIFYEKIWSAFEKFQDSLKVKDKFDNIPRPLSTWVDGTDDYIALVDVTDQGYASAQRGGRGFDIDHTVAILKVLAEFHAVSLAMKHHNPKEFEELASQIKETYFAEKYRTWYIKLQESVIAVALDCVNKELSNFYIEKFKKFVDQDLYTLICKWCAKRGPLSVITHGDVWAPNFLIKYKHGTPRKIDGVMMIDFQLARYTSLAIDISFFLLLCPDVALLVERWDDIILEYYQAMTESLKKFECKPDLVSLEDLNKEVNESMTCAVAVIIEGLVMSLLGDEDVADLDILEGDEAVPLETLWVVHPFKEKEKRERFARVIKFVIDKNLI